MYYETSPHELIEPPIGGRSKTSIFASVKYFKHGRTSRPAAQRLRNPAAASGALSLSQTSGSAARMRPCGTVLKNPETYPGRRELFTLSIRDILIRLTGGRCRSYHRARRYRWAARRYSRGANFHQRYGGMGVFGDSAKRVVRGLAKEFPETPPLLSGMYRSIFPKTKVILIEI